MDERTKPAATARPTTKAASKAKPASKPKPTAKAKPATRAKQRSGHIGQEIGAHKRAAVSHGHDGEVDKADDKPQCGQYPGLFAAQQVCRAEQQRQGGYLADAAVDVSEEEVLEDGELRPV